MTKAPNSLNPDSISELPNLIGAEVTCPDDRAGRIKSLRAKKPWYFDIETPSGVVSSVHARGLKILGEPLDLLLTSNQSPPYRDGGQRRHR